MPDKKYEFLLVNAKPKTATPECEPTEGPDCYPDEKSSSESECDPTDLCAPVDDRADNYKTTAIKQ